MVHIHTPRVTDTFTPNKRKLKEKKDLLKTVNSLVNGWIDGWMDGHTDEEPGHLL